MWEAHLRCLTLQSLQKHCSFSRRWTPLVHLWSAPQSHVHRLGKTMSQMMMYSQDDLCHRFNASVTLFVSIAVYIAHRSMRQASTSVYTRLAPLNYLGVESSLSGYQGDDSDDQTHHLSPALNAAFDTSHFCGFVFWGIRGQNEKLNSIAWQQALYLNRHSVSFHLFSGSRYRYHP